MIRVGAGVNSTVGLVWKGTTAVGVDSPDESNPTVVRGSKGVRARGAVLP